MLHEVGCVGEELVAVGLVVDGGERVVTDGVVLMLDVRKDGRHERLKQLRLVEATEED